MMPDTLPMPILKFLAWLKQTDGRDKLYRLAAYGSKIPLSILDSRSVTHKKLKDGASSIGLSRKLMRMFRSIQFIQDFLNASHNYTGDGFERTIGSFKAIALAIWMGIDHVQWFQKVGYIDLRKSSVQKLSLMHSKSWFWGIFFGLILSLWKLCKLKSSAKFIEQSMKAEDGKTVADNAAVKNKLKIGAFKSLLDIFIPLARLGWFDIGELGVGVCGTLTSLIGIRDTWPK